MIAKVEEMTEAELAAVREPANGATDAEREAAEHELARRYGAQGYTKVTAPVGVRSKVIEHGDGSASTVHTYYPRGGEDAAVVIQSPGRLPTLRVLGSDVFSSAECDSYADADRQAREIAARS